MTAFAIWKQPHQKPLMLLNEGSGEDQIVFVPFSKGAHREVALSGTMIPFNEQAIPKLDAYPSKLMAPLVATREMHTALINRTVDILKTRQLSKVVLARAAAFSLPTPQPSKLFEALCTQFPHALCYVFYHPFTGLWAGASPEILLKCAQSQCTTMSLAGTRDLRNPSPTAWTSKEFEEQRMVTQFIQYQLEEQGIILGPVGPPKELETGHLKHLVNYMTFEQPEDVTQVLSSLHPTPAVCGLPVNESRSYILANEPIDRSYYTGYLAHFGDSSMSAYVNLRCMNWIDDTVYLYAGGGITARSDAASEFEETEAKLAAMLGVIEKMRNFEAHS